MIRKSRNFGLCKFTFPYFVFDFLSGILLLLLCRITNRTHSLSDNVDSVFHFITMLLEIHGLLCWPTTQYLVLKVIPECNISLITRWESVPLERNTGIVPNAEILVCVFIGDPQIKIFLSVIALHT